MLPLVVDTVLQLDLSSHIQLTTASELVVVLIQIYICTGRDADGFEMIKDII